MRNKTWTLGLVFIAGFALARAAPPEPAVAGAGPADFTSVVEALDPGVVHVTTTTSGAGPRSLDDNVGAGFVVDPAGLIVTNRHVVSGARSIQVSVQGRGTVAAQLLGTDDATDVALLRVPLQGLVPLPIGTARGLKVGQWVLAAGSPYRLERSWSVGIVSGLSRTGVGVNPRGLEDYIQTDAAANLGNSGGPLVDAGGRVVGMITAILSRATGHQGISLAIPIEAVMQSVARMRTGGSTRPTIGVRVREERGGLRVTGFDPGSSAAAAGLKLGDLILTVDNTQVRRASELQRLVWAAGSAGTLRLVYDRGGRTLASSVTTR